MNAPRKSHRTAALFSAVAIFALATATVQAPGSVTARGTATNVTGTTTDFDIQAMLTDGPPSGSVRLTSRNDRRTDEVSIVATELEKLTFEETAAYMIGPAIMRKPGPTGPAEFHGSIKVWVTSGDQPTLRAIFHSVEGYDAWEFNGQVTRGTVAIEPPALLTQ